MGSRADTRARCRLYADGHLQLVPSRYSILCRAGTFPAAPRAAPVGDNDGFPARFVASALDIRRPAVPTRRPSEMHAKGQFREREPTRGLACP
jgi:hypothetical protein